MGNFLCSRLSWVGFLASDDLNPSPFSKVTTRGLFRGEELEMDRLAELGLTDSLVRWTASINLKNDRETKSPKGCDIPPSF